VEAHGERGGRQRTDPLDGLAALEVGVPVKLGEGVDQALLNQQIDPFELAKQGCRGLLEPRQIGEALLQGDPGLNQGGAPLQQLLEGAIALGWRTPGTQAVTLVGKIALHQLGVAGIRLGAGADAVAIAAEAVAVDEIDGMTGVMGQVDEVEMKGVGGLGGDADRSGWQGGEPAGDAVAVVVEGLDGLLRAKADGQGGLADVDADEQCLKRDCHD
jgi:hypothetical protein